MPSLQPLTLFTSLLIALLLLTGCTEGESNDDSATHNASADAGADISTTPDEDTGQESPTLVVTPPSGSMSGYFPVEIDLTGTTVTADAITRVQVGQNKAYDLEAKSPTLLQATLQGNPSDGPVDVTLETRDGATLEAPSAFTYEAARDPRFERVMAIGASVTQGVQAGTPSYSGTLMSPPAQLARQLGAYMPLPLLQRGLFPQIQVSDVGPPPVCSTPSVAGFITAAAGDLLPKLENEDGTLEFQKSRVDPELEVHNIAVGGSRIADVLDRPNVANFAVHLIAHMVYEPYGVFGEPVTRSQLELIEANPPSLIISSDLYGNDLISALVNSGGIEIDSITPLDEYEVTLNALLARLNATGAAVFIANMPRPTRLPIALEKRNGLIAQARALAIEEGRDPDAAANAATEEADRLLTEVDDIGQQYNDILAATAEPLPNIHVVDLYGEVERIANEGLQIEGVALSVLKFGGLLTIDGVHFTDTGYAMLANVFIDTINATLGTDVPPIELAPVLANDPGSPASYTAAGFDVEQCVR